MCTRLVLSEMDKQQRFRKLIHKRRDATRNHDLENPFHLPPMPPLERIRNKQQNIPDCPFSTPRYNFSPYFNPYFNSTNYHFGKHSEFLGNCKRQESERWPPLYISNKSDIYYNKFSKEVHLERISDSTFRNSTCERHSNIHENIHGSPFIKKEKELYPELKKENSFKVENPEEKEDSTKIGMIDVGETDYLYFAFVRKKIERFVKM